MLKILDGKNNLVSSVVIGHIDSEDFKPLVETLDVKAKEFGNIRWYLEIEDLYDINVDVLEKSGITSSFNFDKIAIVGDVVIHKLSSYIKEKLSLSDVRFFELKDQAEAHQWIAA